MATTRKSPFGRGSEHGVWLYMGRLDHQRPKSMETAAHSNPPYGMIQGKASPLENVPKHPHGF